MDELQIKARRALELGADPEDIRRLMHSPDQLNRVNAVLPVSGESLAGLSPQQGLTPLPAPSGPPAAPQPAAAPMPAPAPAPTSAVDEFFAQDPNRMAIENFFSGRAAEPSFSVFRPMPEEPVRPGPGISALKRGLLGLGQEGAHLAAYVNGLAGDPEAEQGWLNTAAELEKTIETEFPKYIKSFAEAENLSDKALWGYETVMEQVPFIASLFIPGTLVGKLAGKAAGVATGAAVDAAIMTGESAGTAYGTKEGIEGYEGQVAANGAMKALLDFVPIGLVLGRMGALPIFEKWFIKQAADKGFVRRAGENVATLLATEVPTEVAQEMLDISLEHTITELEEKGYSPEEIARLKETALAAGTFGIFGIPAAMIKPKGEDTRGEVDTTDITTGEFVGPPEYVPPGTQQQLFPRGSMPAVPPLPGTANFMGPPVPPDFWGDGIVQGPEQKLQMELDLGGEPLPIPGEEVMSGKKAAPEVTEKSLRPTARDWGAGEKIAERISILREGRVRALSQEELDDAEALKIEATTLPGERTPAQEFMLFQARKRRVKELRKRIQTVDFVGPLNEQGLISPIRTVESPQASSQVQQLTNLVNRLRKDEKNYRKKDGELKVAIAKKIDRLNSRLRELVPETIFPQGEGQTLIEERAAPEVSAPPALLDERGKEIEPSAEKAPAKLVPKSAKPAAQRAVEATTPQVPGLTQRESQILARLEEKDDIGGPGLSPGEYDVYEKLLSKAAGEVKAPRMSEQQAFDKLVGAIDKLGERTVRKSSSGKGGPGFTVEQVRKLIAPLETLFGVRVNVTTRDQVPVDLKPSDVGVYVQNADGSREVYIIADAITSPTEAVKTYIHEVVGHYGVSLVLTRGELAALQRMAGFKTQLELEEYIARAAENEHLDPTFLNRVIAMFIRALRRMGVKVKLSRSEIREILADSRNALFGRVSSNNSPQNINQSTRYVRKSASTIEEFLSTGKLTSRLLQKIAPGNKPTAARVRQVLKEINANKIEIQVAEDVLASMDSKFTWDDFVTEYEKQLVPLTITPTDQWSEYGVYEADLGQFMDGAETRMYEGDWKTPTEINVHFSEYAPGYVGHVRSIDQDQQNTGPIRRIIEIQSDVAQRVKAYKQAMGDIRANVKSPEEIEDIKRRIRETENVQRAMRDGISALSAERRRAAFESEPAMQPFESETSYNERMSAAFARSKEAEVGSELAKKPLEAMYKVYAAFLNVDTITAKDWFTAVLSHGLRTHQRMFPQLYPEGMTTQELSLGDVDKFVRRYINHNLDAQIAELEGSMGQNVDLSFFDNWEQLEQSIIPRMLREEIRLAAQEGVDELRVAGAATVADVEQWWVGGSARTKESGREGWIKYLSEQMVAISQLHRTGYSDLISPDALEGRYYMVLPEMMDGSYNDGMTLLVEGGLNNTTGYIEETKKFYDYKGLMELLQSYKDKINAAPEEAFLLPHVKGIYRRYKKEMPKILKQLGFESFTGENGKEWYSRDIKPSKDAGPIVALYRSLEIEGGERLEQETSDWKGLWEAGKFGKWFYTPIQMDKRFGRFAPEYHEYLQQVEAWWKTKVDRMAQANPVAENWNKLSDTQGKRVGEALFMANSMSDDKGRKLLPDEEMQLLDKLELNDAAKKVYFDVKGSLEETIDKLEEGLKYNAVRDLIEDNERAAAFLKEWEVAKGDGGKELDLLTRYSLPGEVLEGSTIAGTLKDIETDMKKLRQRNYFPRMRFGQNAVTVRAKTDVVFEGKEFKEGHVVVFEAYENSKSQDAAAKDWIKELDQSKFLVQKTQLADKEFSFVGMPPGLINTIKSELELDDQQIADLKEIFVKVSPGRAFLRHLIARRGVAGFNADAKRVYASYMLNAANHIARVEHYKDMQHHLEKLNMRRKGYNPDATMEARKTNRSAPPVMDPMVDRNLVGELANYADRHYKYIMNPGNDLAKLRAMGFMWYLGFNAKSAVVNLSQVPLVTFPYLGERFGDVRASRAIARAMPAAAKFLKAKTKANISPEILEVIKRLTDAGLLDESIATELAGFSESTVLERIIPRTEIGRFYNKFTYASAAMFRWAEKYNRHVTAIASAQLALEDNANIEQAYLAAKDAIQSTQFEYAKWNRPAFQRGKKSVFFLFWQYMQHASFLAFGGHGQGTAVRFWLMLVMAAGLQGLPFAENLLDIIDFGSNQAKKLTGSKDPHTDIRADLRRFLVSLTDNAEFTDGILHGSSRYFGMGPLHMLEMMGIPVPNVDTSGSLSLGRPIPGLQDVMGPSRSPEEKFGRAIVEMMGPVMGMPYAIWRSANDTNPDTWKKWERAMPTAAKSISKYLRWSERGAEEFRGTGDVVQFDPTDIDHRLEQIAQGLGFAPTRLNQRYELNAAQNVAQQWYSRRRSLLLEDYTYSRLTNNPEMAADVRKAIREYNHSVPDKKLTITPDSMKKSLRERQRRAQLRTRGVPAAKMYRGLYREYEEIYPTG